MRKTKFKVVLLLILISASFILYYRYFGRSVESTKEKFIRISGTVDVDLFSVSSLVPGKIKEVLVDEGMSVRKGEALALLDDKEYRIRLKGLEAALKGAEARYRMIRKGARKEDIARMRERLRQAKIVLDNAKKNYERAKKLYSAGVFPRKKYDDAYYAYKRALAGYKAVLEEYRKVLKGSRPEEIEMALAEVERIKANIEAVKEKIEDCVIRAPVDGVVIHKLVNAGEVVPVGKPLFSLANLSVVKVRGYVLEKELGFLKVGKKVLVYVDSFSDRPLEGVISYISDVAEFTPKNVQTREERVKLVYKIKVRVENKDGFLKLGMPVDILISKAP